MRIKSIKRKKKQHLNDSSMDNVFSFTFKENNIQPLSVIHFRVTECKAVFDFVLPSIIHY